MAAALDVMLDSRREVFMVFPPMDQVVPVVGQAVLALYGGANLLWKVFRMFFPKK